MLWFPRNLFETGAGVGAVNRPGCDTTASKLVADAGKRSTSAGSTENGP
jgi:hypothetical protein